MNTKKLFFTSLGRVAFFLLAVQPVHASGTLTFSQALLTPAAVTAGEPVSYRFTLTCADANMDCGTVLLEDTLPEALEVVNCIAPADFTAVACDTANPVIKLSKNNVLKAGETLDVDVHARLKVDATAGTAVVNTATATISIPDNLESAVITATAPQVLVGTGSNHW